MNSISITYTLKYELGFAPEYKWSDHNQCFNVKTGRRIKQVYNNGCIGYSIRGSFKSLKFLRNRLVKIQEVEYPF
jgi:hypothetical protein